MGGAPPAERTKTASIFISSTPLVDDRSSCVLINPLFLPKPKSPGFKACPPLTARRPLCAHHHHHQPHHHKALLACQPASMCWCWSGSQARGLTSSRQIPLAAAAGGNGCSQAAAARSRWPAGDLNTAPHAGLGLHSHSPGLSPDRSPLTQTQRSEGPEFAEAGVHSAAQRAVSSVRVTGAGCTSTQ